MMGPAGAPDLILHRGRFTTLDRSNPIATAVAVKDGVFNAVGRDEDVMPLAGATTQILRSRRPPSVARPNRQSFAHHPRWLEFQHGAALGWRTHPRRRHGHVEAASGDTPPPQWVRVVGGFTAHQFAEKRLPTIEELNAVAPDTPVFLVASLRSRLS